MTKLKALRKAKNITQSKLSELASVNLRTLQDYEQGAKDINKAAGISLYKIAKVLECSIEDLLEIE